MKKTTIAAIMALTLLGSCHEVETFEATPVDTFECLWQTIDTKYCYFDHKDIDWDEVHERYRPRVMDDMTSEQLFEVCAEMLNELRDGHVNLSSPFDVSYYRRWWTDWPQDFDYRVVQQYYLDFDYRSIGAIDYKILPQNIGYIRYPSFSSLPGEGNLNYIFSYLAACDGLIIDIRDNGGGAMTNITPFVSRLIHSEMTAGYMRHKTGPGHNDFSDPYPITYTPAGSDRVVWNKPVAVLINRSCYSAANDFAMVMRQVPGVTLVGARTGGGGGLPLSSSLPNGWNVRFSSAPVTDADGNDIEEGIDPSPGCETHALPEDLAAGHDPIIDRAIEILSQK